MQISTYHAFLTLFDYVFRKPPPEHFLIIIAPLPVNFLAITNNQKCGSSDDWLLQNDALRYWASHIYPSEREYLRIWRFVIDNTNIVFPRLAEWTIFGSDHDEAFASDGNVGQRCKYQHNAKREESGCASEHAQSCQPVVFCRFRQYRLVSQDAPN